MVLYHQAKGGNADGQKRGRVQRIRCIVQRKEVDGLEREISMNNDRNIGGSVAGWGGLSLLIPSPRVC